MKSYVTTANSGLSLEGIQRCLKTAKPPGFWKRRHKKPGTAENQLRDQTCWYVHTGIRKCLDALIWGEKEPQLQSPQTFPERKR